MTLLTPVQILHSELETALQSVQSQLEATEAELEKQRTLNEQLETDLLHMDSRKEGGANGASPSPLNGRASPVDVLAGLDIGKKSNVSIPFPF